VIEASAFRGRKTYTAVMRVKNEEEFLEASLRSIVDLVEEVVIVDNQSTDRTPELIDQLVSEHPGKIKSFVYPYDMARYGEENAALASTWRGRRSPRLLANFYNWTLKRCSHPFVLKWDGDTIATSEMAEALDDFRHTQAQTLWHIGANLHPDGQHLIASQPFELFEPRLFYKRFAHYNNGLVYCELLKSSFLESDRYKQSWPDPLYVHMKYCKAHRFDNISLDLKSQVSADTTPGQPVSPDVRATIQRWHLCPEQEPKR